MPKVMTIRGLGNVPIAGAYQAPPVHVLEGTGRRHSMSVAGIQGLAMARALGRAPMFHAARPVALPAYQVVAPQYTYDAAAARRIAIPGMRGGLGRLGDAAADRANAGAVAASIRDACRAACSIGYPNTNQATQRTQCQGACDVAYSSAMAAINAATPIQSTPDPTAAATADRLAELERIRREQEGELDLMRARAGLPPAAPAEEKILGLPKNVAIGAGILAALVGGYLLLK